jgi:outer membrane protein OmpA-like peptidoglycan-associated protein
MDRSNRLERLSRQFGAQPPVLQSDLQVAAGTLPGVNYAVPVIRMRYAEKTFFDFDSAQVRPDAIPVLDVLAEAMKRDLPDTSLVILGHTDSKGSVGYNANLSLRRAASVMIELANRGVAISEMSTVAIGEMQPIASNETDEGRAQNRRVEFVISRYQDANLKVIESTLIKTKWLANSSDATPLPLKREAAALNVMSPSTDILSKEKTANLIKKDKSFEVLKETSRIVTIIPEEQRTVNVLPE